MLADGGSSCASVSWSLLRPHVHFCVVFRCQLAAEWLWGTPWRRRWRCAASFLNVVPSTEYKTGKFGTGGGGGGSHLGVKTALRSRLLLWFWKRRPCQGSMPVSYYYNNLPRLPLKIRPLRPLFSAHFSLHWSRSLTFCLNDGYLEALWEAGAG